MAALLDARFPGPGVRLSSVVRAPDERRRLGVLDSSLEGLLAKKCELGGRVELFHGKRTALRAQVLPDRDDVAPGARDVADGLQNLLDRLAQPNHDPALRTNVEAVLARVV